MTFVKREYWTEEQVNELPAGEHDYFERKSGMLFDVPDRNSLLDKIAKAASAFANSGGGHLILGVTDAGKLDGVPRIWSGRTTTRDWLEQKIPQLLDYRLNDFRVHVVGCTASTQIPAGRDVIVIDFGDSALAPHQSVRDHTYYYRSAGRSLPAPHFYLELLRQRQTSPDLDFELTDVEIEAWLHQGQPVLRVDAKFLIENTGRMAAYKWALVARSLKHPDGRGDDYYFGAIPGATGRSSSIRVDDTILPGCTLRESKIFGVRLRPAGLDEGSVRADLTDMLGSLRLTLQLATESSPGAIKEVSFTGMVDLEKSIEILKSSGVIKT
ncbi:MAG: ATP-binding protein [Bradyrhizobium sp.]|uniref:AlbA family DNA-binding domain-containing protein n=1 Tax=Bradyrhizobium sp. TaxID=376 RepID=UPI001A2E9D12|nr:ATP-binding protein [Bradyrhizobium sp.]MBJ7405027.1 ATP-binding protein [Bradyrhizobium sp.]